MGEWIKVSERLPEPYVSVLVYIPKKVSRQTVHEGFITRRGEWYAEGINRYPDEVVAWREMPEPPEAE